MSATLADGDGTYDCPPCVCGADPKIHALEGGYYVTHTGGPDPDAEGFHHHNVEGPWRTTPEAAVQAWAELLAPKVSP